MAVGDQQFSSLRFQQSRNDGVITHETAYASELAANGVYSIFDSIDAGSPGFASQNRSTRQSPSLHRPFLHNLPHNPQAFYHPARDKSETKEFVYELRCSMTVLST